MKKLNNTLRRNALGGKIAQSFPKRVPMTFRLFAVVLAIVGLVVVPNLAHAEAPPVFLSKIGAEATGEQLQSPTGVATDATGNVYVVDAELGQVKKFTESGTFILKWGSLGSGNGQLNNPRGIAVDNFGDVYVADTGNNRIQKFSSTGSYILQWGVAGSGDGEFGLPFGIAFSNVGAIYVTDLGNNRIQVFGLTGAFENSWGTLGAADGQFSSPQGIVISDSGTVYVADTSNSRIQKFTADGVYLEKWSVALPAWLALGTGNDVHVTSAANNTLSKYSPSGGLCGAVGMCPYATSGHGDTDVYQPAGIASGLNNKIFVVDAGNYKIKKYNSLGASPITFDTSWGAQAFTDDDQFNKPNVVFVDSLGDTFVVANNLIIKKYDSSGAYMTEWGNGDFSGINDVAIDANDNIYVADISGVIKKYNVNGVYITEWGTFTGTTFVTVDSVGDVYVYDYDTSVIGRYDPSDGSLIDSWTYTGDSLAGMHFDHADNLYVSDDANNIIQKYTKSGVPITQWGSTGSGDGQFQVIRGFAFDQDNNVYIADSGTSRIQKFSSTGVYLSQWGSQGVGDGQFGNVSPGYMNVTIDRSGNIFVSDFYNNRVQKFGYAAVTPPATGGSGSSGSGSASSTKKVASVSSSPAVSDTASESSPTEVIVNNFTDFFGSSGKDLYSLKTGDVIGFCIHASTTTDTCSKGGLNYHTATIKSIDLSDPDKPIVVVIVASTPKDYSLGLGSPKLVDVDSDGINDISISLVSVTGGMATLNFRSIAAISSTPAPQKEAVAQVKKTSHWVWYVVVGVVLFGLIVYVSRRGRPSHNA